MMRKISVVLLTVFFIFGFAQSVSLYDPGNNAVYPDSQYFCSGSSFNLKVDAVATSTGDYQIIKDQFSNFPLAAGSIPITFQSASTNKFSDSFPIGFNFSFYGKTYTRAVLGSNGRLVFTNDPQRDLLKDVTTYTDRTFSGVTGYNTFSALPSTDYNKVYRNNPTQELNLAQIFFGYTDLIPKSVNGSVTYLYKNVTVGGVNGLLVSFQNMIRTNGLGSISSVAYYSYVLLLEDGRIVVYVNNKTESSYNAILGIQNDNATKFKVPQHSNNAYNYNNGPWISEGVVWVFKPNQNLTPQFKWYRNATLLPETTSTLTNFVPNDGDVLKVEVTYYDDSGTQVGAAVSDQVTFNQLKKPQITDPDYSSGCGNPALISVINPDPNLIYEWHSTTDPTFLQTGTGINVGNGTYFVRVKSSTTTCTVDSDPKTVNVSSNLPPFLYENQTLRRCDNLKKLSNTFDLFTIVNYPATANYSVEFLDASGNVISNMITINNLETRTFFIHVKTNPGVTPSCEFTKKFFFAYLSMHDTNNLHYFPRLCSGTNSFSVQDFRNWWVIPVNGDPVFYDYSKFDIYFSTDGVNYNTNPVNPLVNNPTYIKLKHPDFSCELSGEINFVISNPVIANQPTTGLPEQCDDPAGFFDLASLIPQINSDPTMVVTFHTSLSDAQNGTNAVPNNYHAPIGTTTLYIRVANSDGCTAPNIPTINVVVYKKPNIISPNPIVLKNCSGSPVFDLTQNVSNLTDAVAPVIPQLSYHAQNGTLLTATQVKNYDSSVFGMQPFVVIRYNPTCYDTVNFDLSFYPKPVSQVSQILVCDELTYSLQDFKNAVITNPANYSFTDDLGNPLPNNFDLSVLPKTVKFLIKDLITTCISDVQTVVFVQGGASALLNTETEYSKCDEDFDGITTFNLDSRKSDFTAVSGAVFEYFKDIALTHKINSQYTNETPFLQTVYVKVTLPGFCPAKAKINLKVNIPAASGTLQDKYYICYGENLTIDGGTENIQWEWSTGETTQTIQISKVGDYWVKLTDAAGCFYTHHFTVSDENQPKITAVNQTNTSIEVIAEGGAKPYTYYFNGIPQSSNILNNPTASSYTIQVKSATGCLGEPKTVYFIKVHNVFTPNSDGINDFWTVENLGKMQNVQVKIANRFGQLVYDYGSAATSYTSTGTGSGSGRDPVWDGKLNGKALPTASYWYVATWFDPVTNRNEQRQGWILLKNRD